MQAVGDFSYQFRTKRLIFMRDKSIAWLIIHESDEKKKRIARCAETKLISHGALRFASIIIQMIECRSVRRDQGANINVVNTSEKLIAIIIRTINVWYYTHRERMRQLPCIHPCRTHFELEHFISLERAKKGCANKKPSDLVASVKYAKCL